MKRRIRTNSGAISMSKVETSSLAEPVSTKKKKKSESTEPARTVTTVRSFQTREVDPRFA